MSAAATNTVSTLLKDDVLREVAKPVSFDLGLSVAQTLVGVLEKIEGVGLAAPQVGISARVAIVSFDGQRLVLINPTIALLGRPRDRIESEEGCLSLPSRLFRVKRAQIVTVTSSLPGGRMTITARDWLARILQHEIDHLDGVCIDQRGSEVHGASV